MFTVAGRLCNNNGAARQMFVYTKKKQAGNGDVNYNTI